MKAAEAGSQACERKVRNGNGPSGHQGVQSGGEFCNNITLLRMKRLLAKKNVKEKSEKY